MGKIIRNNVQYAGLSDAALNIKYNNTESGLKSKTAQAAIDELSNNIGKLDLLVGSVLISDGTNDTILEANKNILVGQKIYCKVPASEYPTTYKIKIEKTNSEGITIFEEELVPSNKMEYVKIITAENAIYTIPNDLSVFLPSGAMNLNKNIENINNNIIELNNTVDKLSTVHAIELFNSSGVADWATTKYITIDLSDAQLDAIVNGKYNMILFRFGVGNQTIGSTSANVLSIGKFNYTNGWNDAIDILQGKTAYYNIKAAEKKMYVWCDSNPTLKLRSIHITKNL